MERRDACILTGSQLTGAWATCWTGHGSSCPRLIHAVFLDAEWAATLGWSYVVPRAFYPLAFYKKAPYAVTAINYVSIYLLFAPIVSIVVKELLKQNE